MEIKKKYLLEHGNQEDPLENKEKEEGIIGKWQCTICTFMNEKGTKKCEMCENDIPIEKLKEFEEAYKKKNEEKKEEKDDKVINNINNDNDNKNIVNYLFKDVIIKYVFICYNSNSNEPFAPFILIAILFDNINKRMIIVTYKLMINILVPKDFIRYENNNFENNINQKKFSTIESAMQNLTEYYFDNINTLYPLFLGENKDNIYNHLIPIEEKHLSISVSQVFDSYVFDNKNEIKLCVLAEVGKEKNKIFIFNIKNKEKLNDIGKDSIIIEEIEDKEEIDIKKNFESIEQNLNLSEVKIFKDLNYIYLFNKKGYLSIDNQEKIKPVKFEKEIPSFQQIIPQFNSKEEIYKFEIYDECNIIDIKINNSQDKNEEIKIQQEPKNIDIEKLDINSLSEREIILLSKMFDFQRVNIQLSNNPSNVKGLIKSQTENPNEYNKIYFNNTSKKKTLYLSNNQFILLSNIDILLNPKKN